MKAIKHGADLIFTCDDGKTVKYNLNTGVCIGKNGKASCCNEDVFDLKKGIYLAYARCKTKETKEKINKLTKELNYYTPAYWMM